MSTILAITACPTGTAHSIMAAEALKMQAAQMGHRIVGPGEVPLSGVDAVIVATDTATDLSPYAGKPLVAASTAMAIRDPAGIIHAALAKTGSPAPAPAAAPVVAAPAPVVPAPAGHRRRLVAITACPTGIAHTFMAAEALRRQATQDGHEIFVETQGSVGAKNLLTDEQIAAADAVIIAADTAVNESRFGGKTVYRTDTGAALKKPAEVIAAALAAAPAPGSAPVAAAPASLTEEVRRAKAKMAEKRSGPYRHLLTGVSYMLPVVVAGGLLIAISFIWGITAFKEEGTLAAALMKVGGGAAFALMVPVLSGFIAYSISDRPGLAPGLVGGMLASQLGAGFLGGIVSGFIAGYTARWLRDHIRLPDTLAGLMPVLIIPLIATAITGLLMIYVVGTPVKAIMDGLTAWLAGLSTTNGVFLGLILGAMMAFDMGGPVNKAAYAFSVGLLSSNTFAPMAAVMAAGMTPPLGLALAATLAKHKFTTDEHEASKAAFVLGLCFITEGAIPFAAKDPLRVIPCTMFGAAVTGALSMVFGCTLRAPHGGLFVLAIPNAVGNVGSYLLAIIIGAVLTGLALMIVKRPVAAATAATGAAHA